MIQIPHPIGTLELSRGIIGIDTTYTYHYTTADVDVYLLGISHNVTGECGFIVDIQRAPWVTPNAPYNPTEHVLTNPEVIAIIAEAFGVDVRDAGCRQAFTRKWFT